MNQPWVYMCSASWTPLPPPSPSQHWGSAKCASPEHPVSCIEPGLVICFTYDNIHVSMLFSQIIPPSHSPTESKRQFFTSVSLLLPHIITIFLNSIYMLFCIKDFYISLLFVNLCLTSLSRVKFIVWFLFFERWGHLNKKLYTH